MANIHVNRGGTSLGTFPEEEVREGLQSARFLSTDLGWREGMANWLPLAQFPEFAAGTAAAAGPAATVPASSAVSAATPPAARSGLPWEHRHELGLFPAFFETLKLVLFKPDIAFTTMKTEGGLIDPMIYGVIGGSVGLAFYFLFSMLLSSIGFMADKNALAGLLGLGLYTVFLFILIPFLVVLGFFVSSAILHLCLMLVGGANRSFETTFRVVCFVSGSTHPLFIIPLCGSFISTVWAIVAECIGLARAHETSTGNAVLAVLLPLIVCCGGGLLMAFMFGLLGGLMHH